MILDLIAGLSIIAHFMAISKGVLALTDVIYFVAMIGLWLDPNAAGAASQVSRLKGGVMDANLKQVAIHRGRSRFWSLRWCSYLAAPSLKGFAWI